MTNLETRANVEKFVRDHVEAHGVPPTMGDVMEKFDVPRMSAWRYHKRAVEALGVTPAPQSATRLPEDVRLAVVADLRSGMSVGETARRNGVAPTTARRLRDQNGIPPAPSGMSGAPGRKSAIATSRVYDKVFELTAANEGVPPLQREVAESLGITEQVVGHHVATLASRGLLLPGQNMVGISLRGERFHQDCIYLARMCTPGQQPGVSRRSPVPQSAQATVMRLIIPVISKPKALKDGRDRTSWSVVEATVAHYCARYGRPATPLGIQKVLKGSHDFSEDTIRSALRNGLEAGVYRPSGEGRSGVMPASGDPLVAPALALSRESSTGWSPQAYNALRRVLRVVLLG